MTENTNVARVERNEVDQAPQRQPATILDVIQNIASNPEIDIDRMQALLRLRAEEEDRVRRLTREDRAEDERRAWLRDWAAVQSEIGPIVRTKTNTHTRSEYEDLASIDAASRPVLAKYGFSIRAVNCPGAPEGHIRMTLEIGHREGHVMRDEPDDFPLDRAGAKGNDNKTAIQAKGSTETYARRYLLRRALNIAPVNDNDGNAPQGATPTINADQFRELKDIVVNAGGFEAEQFICQRFGLENINELRLQDFGLAMTILRQKSKKLAEDRGDA